MISSMTGFGAGRSLEGEGEFSVEARSVNHKFCEVRVRMPHELNALETELVRHIKDRVCRGAIDVSIKRPKAARTHVSLVVDRNLARDYLAVTSALAREFSLKGEIDLRALAQVEGIVNFESQPIDLKALRAPLFAALDEALDALQAMRRREGDALRVDLRQRLGVIREQVSAVAQLTPQTIERYRQRLDDRLAELTREMVIDPQRLAQEVALFADRVDVAEELTRLDAHLRAFDKLLDGDGAVGRRMDFLLQEINREVNTIGSKSQSVDIAQIVVSLKAEIERVREQIQNIE
ncbi:MAG: YicC family protein [Myxococcales bacterium]|jgi:uncharacterized protein (TIGR00255 family)|nr:YicC family protein [Myxococcales bacterium]